MRVNCKQCNKEFYAKPSSVKNGKSKFCSRVCYGEWQSQNNINRFDIAQYLRENPKVREKSNLKKRGRKLTEEHKKKVSESLKKINVLSRFKKGDNIGNKHPNWKGGKILYWKNKRLSKDKHTCQVCGLKDKLIMDVHHIKPVKNEQDRRYGIQDIKNLITLCPNCHRKVHKKIVKLPTLLI